MIDFIVYNTTFSNISAISWRPVLVVEEAGSTRRKPPTMGKQLVNFITCSCRVFSCYEYGAWHGKDIYNLGTPYSKLTLARRVLLVARELLTRLDLQNTSSIFMGIGVSQFVLVLCVVLGLPLFLYLFFYLWPLHCQSFFDVWPLIISFVSANLVYYYMQH